MKRDEVKALASSVSNGHEFAQASVKVLDLKSTDKWSLFHRYLPEVFQKMSVCFICMDAISDATLSEHLSKTHQT